MKKMCKLKKNRFVAYFKRSGIFYQDLCRTPIKLKLSTTGIISNRFFKNGAYLLIPMLYYRTYTMVYRKSYDGHQPEFNQIERRHRYETEGKNAVNM